MAAAGRSTEEQVVAAADGGAALKIPAPSRAWAIEAGFRVADEGFAGQGAADAPPRLSIASPENDSRIWRNPDAPPGLGRIALKALVEPRAAQVVWYVDGAPFAVADPDQPLFWPLQKGAHEFQLRLPLRPGASKVVRIVVE